jgi:sodium-dependent dicarboxylate transporter 2/3/5
MALSLALAVLVAVAVPYRAADPVAARMTGVAVLMALWWVLEVVPIPVTSLLPLLLLPALGIGSLREVASAYGKPVIFLFLGGFMLALGLQRSGLHRRIALHIVAAIGSRPSRIVLGFMVASAALSMWISNTASVMVTMPIAVSVLEQAKEHSDEKGEVVQLGTALMLGIAYAADIGGMATPVGTPPNLVLVELYTKLLPGRPPISFAQWMTLGLPISLVFLACGWWLLTHVIFRLHSSAIVGEDDGGEQVVKKGLAGLGPMSRDEKLSGAVFAAAALLWVTGADLRLGRDFVVHGWRSLLGLGEVGDAAVAVGAAALLFAIPSATRKGDTLMDWETTRDIPWGLLLLFGGGFALAGGFESSGLSLRVGHALGALRGAPDAVVVAAVCAVLTMLTEVTSNTATATLVLPILARTAPALDMDPLMLMIPATLSASCAFMMPVASPTQAIVFGSGYVPIRQMVRAGIWFNILGVALVTLVFLLLGPALFSIAR